MSLRLAVEHFKQMEEDDWKVLYHLSRFIYSFMHVSEEVLSKATGLEAKRLDYRLRRLHEFGFVGRSRRGYTLLTAGLDALALRTLVGKGLISGMGREIGVGKEADVYEAVDDEGNRRALKLYRIGRISFRDTRRKRAYSSPLIQHRWLVVNIRAAGREWKALKKVHPLGALVPKPYGRSRHALVLELIDGALLCEVKELDDPKGVLMDVLESLRIAYSAGLINGDLSEFNVLYDGERAWIIDWPQAVRVDHPNAEELLRRDLSNILRYFRKVGLDYPLEKALEYVRSV